MSAIVHTRARSVASLADVIVGWVRDRAEAASKRAAFRRTVAELSALGDRELDDLGVNRWDIERVAARSVWGR